MDPSGIPAFNNNNNNTCNSVLQFPLHLNNISEFEILDSQL
jgi:hypothetical protein